MVSVGLIVLPFILLIISSICAVGMSFWVWPGIEDIKTKIEQDGYIYGIFSQEMFFTMLKALAISLVSALMVFTALFFLMRDAFAYMCSSFWIQLILNIGPLILEIVGIILAAVGIGIPIIAIGMFLEVFTIICDIMNGDLLNTILGVVGLVPLAGLPFSIARGVSKIL